MELKENQLLLNRHGKYLYAGEEVVQAGNYDSPHYAIVKNHDDGCWHNQTTLCFQYDKRVWRTGRPIVTREILMTIGGYKELKIKRQMSDKGLLISIQRYDQNHISKLLNENYIPDEGVYIELYQQYFSRDDLIALRHLLIRPFNRSQAASCLNISPSALDTRVTTLRQRFFKGLSREEIKDECYFIGLDSLADFFYYAKNLA